MDVYIYGKAKENQGNFFYLIEDTGGVRGELG